MYHAPEYVCLLSRRLVYCACTEYLCIYLHSYLNEV